LKALILNNNQLVSFPSNASLPKALDTLVLSHNAALDQLPVTMLRKLTNLTKLSCSHTALHEIPNLQECWSLKEIRLASNKIFTLDSISRCLPLTVEIIDIGHNLIRDAKELDNLLAFKKLSSLNIRGNLTDEKEEEGFLKKACEKLPNLRIFNGRNLKPTKPAKRSHAEFRLKPERANKNTKITFE
jgi:Leucine-rich repeat (LRR) protein